LPDGLKKWKKFSSGKICLELFLFMEDEDIFYVKIQERDTRIFPNE